MSWKSFTVTERLQAAGAHDLAGANRPGRGGSVNWGSGGASIGADSFIAENRSLIDFCAEGAMAMNGRSERIRTSGPCLPKTVLYQAELHSAPKKGLFTPRGGFCKGAKAGGCSLSGNRKRRFGLAGRPLGIFLHDRPETRAVLVPGQPGLDGPGRSRLPPIHVGMGELAHEGEDRHVGQRRRRAE